MVRITFISTDVYTETYGLFAKLTNTQQEDQCCYARKYNRVLPRKKISVDHVIAVDKWLKTEQKTFNHLRSGFCVKWKSQTSVQASRAILVHYILHEYTLQTAYYYSQWQAGQFEVCKNYHLGNDTDHVITPIIFRCVCGSRSIVLD